MKSNYEYTPSLENWEPHIRIKFKEGHLVNKELQVQLHDVEYTQGRYHAGIKCIVALYLLYSTVKRLFVCELSRLYSRGACVCDLWFTKNENWNRPLILHTNRTIQYTTQATLKYYNHMHNCRKIITSYYPILVHTDYTHALVVYISHDIVHMYMYWTEGSVVL